VAIDPRKGQSGGSDWISSEPYTPSQSGIYTVTATAQQEVGLPISASYSFRVLAAGGTQSDPLPDDPPAVITALTVPAADRTGVPITTFAQIVFTEPVRHLAGEVSLLEGTAEAPVVIRLSGVGPSGPVSDITDNSVVVTSLTIQPLSGLQYGTRYQLSLGAGIVDLDPTPKYLTATTSTFTTFVAKTIGGSAETFSTRGLVVLGDRGYLGEANVVNDTAIHVFNVSDPTKPKTVPDLTPETVSGLPLDLVGEERTPVIEGEGEYGRLLVLATGPAGYPFKPTNVLLFDATTDHPTWIGAASVAATPSDGLINRMALRGDRLYTVTAGLGKGIQVIDLLRARTNFANARANPISPFDDLVDSHDMLMGLAADGVGFGCREGEC
jgi:Big-like domain-containing protein